MGFKQRLRDGYEYQRAVAHDLLDLGWTVRLPPLQVRPTFADRADYSDDGDIWVQRPGSDAWEAVEVKSRNLDFTGVGDYPYDEVFCESVGSWSRRGGPAGLYLSTSTETGKRIVLDVTEDTIFQTLRRGHSSYKAASLDHWVDWEEWAAG